MMIIQNTNIEDVKIIKPNIYDDERGYFLNLTIKINSIES